MAPRTRAAARREAAASASASGSPPRAAMSLASLPDDLLLRLFEEQRLKQRHQALPLVCKQFAAVAYSPELLREVDVTLCGPDLLPKVRSFSAWLMRRAAPYAGTLVVSLLSGGGPRPSDGDAAEIVASLAAAAAACAAAGPLFMLLLDLDDLGCPLRLGSWAAGLEQLGLMRVLAAGNLEVTWSLASLNLDVLELRGSAISFLPGVALPTSLSRLELGFYGGDESEHLPPQVAQLTNLSVLELSGGGSDSYFDDLTRLTALQELTLVSASDLPSCLSALTSLRALNLSASPFAVGTDEEVLELMEGWEEADLDPALHSLTGLTRLVIEDPPPAVCFPPSLSRLCQLQRLGWLGACPGNPRLPGGPWLHSLRELLLPATAAASNASLWAQATQLQCLDIPDFFASAEEAARAPSGQQEFLLGQARPHPALRKLCLGCSGALAPTCPHPCFAGVQRQGGHAAGPLQIVVVKGIYSLDDFAD